MVVGGLTIFGHARSVTPANLRRSRLGVVSMLLAGPLHPGHGNLKAWWLRFAKNIAPAVGCWLRTYLF